MPGTNAGTGMPINFRCSACRRRSTLWAANRGGYRNDVKLTGRKRMCPPGNARGRNSTHSREYKCQTCGHVGWSRHKDLERMADE